MVLFQEETVINNVISYTMFTNSETRNKVADILNAIFISHIKVVKTSC